MSGIRSRNTRPELQIRLGLHALGFRYRLHDNRLVGKPDLVFGSRQAVIFVHGCFWHGHDCSLFRLPASRTEFWERKIERNRERDAYVNHVLEESGWRTLTVWECALRGKFKLGLDTVLTQAAHWLRGPHVSSQIRGEG